MSRALVIYVASPRPEGILGRLEHVFPMKNNNLHMYMIVNQSVCNINDIHVVL